MTPAVFDLSTASGKHLPSDTSRHYILNGFALDPPPERIHYGNHLRVTMKNVGIGLTADVGGEGGCEIVVSGKVPKRLAGWYLALREQLRQSSRTGEPMIWNDPFENLTYDVLCPQFDNDFDKEYNNFYCYEIKLEAQVLGLMWATSPVVSRSTTAAVPAFDQQSIGEALNDALLALEGYKSTGGGNG